jgi:hypothetical protein
MFLLHARIHSGDPEEIPDLNAEASQNIVFQPPHFTRAGINVCDSSHIYIVLLLQDSDRESTIYSRSDHATLPI